MRIVGIDPSLTSTGIAVIDGATTVIVRTDRIESGPPKRARGDKTPASVTERTERLSQIAATVMEWTVPGQTALAVIEGPSYASAGAGTWDRAGLWWQLVTRLHRADIPIVLVPPTVRAKWATGSGSAGKSPIAVHLSRLWPELDAGVSDDEWDALALASIGAQHLGWVPLELARHREQLDKIVWPDMLADFCVPTERTAS